MNRIEICGAIAAGKSTLAARVAERLSRGLVAERFEDIPHWRLFY